VRSTTQAPREAPREAPQIEPQECEAPLECEREASQDSDSKSSTDGEPAEGEDLPTVFAICSSNKEGESFNLWGLVDSVEKAEKYLTDWVEKQISYGHWGDEVSRHTADAAKCELCELRKFKTLQTRTGLQVKLWDGRIAYATAEQVM